MSNKKVEYTTAYTYFSTVKSICLFLFLHISLRKTGKKKTMGNMYSVFPLEGGDLGDF